MNAKDIMTANVVTVTPDTEVIEVAKLMLERHISAVPVVDANNRVLGIISEADLVRRPEVSGRRRRWLSFLIGGDEELANEYVKTHGSRAEDVMTHPAVTVTEDTAVDEIARLFERRRIKRVPVVRDGKLIGIVSRNDLLPALVTYITTSKEQLKAAPALDDQAIREKFLEILREGETPYTYINVTVTNGVIHLWGMLRTDQERHALHIAAEGIPGVKAIEDHLGTLPRGGLAD